VAAPEPRAGFVTHSGGISLTKGSTSAVLSDLRANQQLMQQHMQNQAPDADQQQ